jgi:TetR/AcrR family transcriptional regulator, cholesterol catabolism regulator
MFSEQQDKWLQRVEALFLRYGIKSFTMDDVARELGISKKTLYAFVENKDDLVEKVMDRHIAEQCVMEARFHEQADDAIDEMLSVVRQSIIDMQQIRPNVIFEMQKYHRPVWEKVERFQKEHIYTVLKKNLEWGKNDGLYRDDFDTDIAIKFHITTSFAIFDDGIFPKNIYPLDRLFKECILTFLHAITSEKGRATLETKMKAHEQRTKI